MAKLDFKLKIEEKIEKDIDVKPFLVIFILLIFPIFYSTWTIYSYFEYSKELKNVENRLVEENLKLKKIKKMVRIYGSRPQIEKKLISQDFVDNYRLKKSIFTEKKLKNGLTVECNLVIPKNIFDFHMDGNSKKVEIPRRSLKVKLLRGKKILLIDKFVEVIPIKKEEMGFLNFYSNVEINNLKIEFKEKKIMLDFSKFTKEVEIDSSNNYDVELGTLEAILNYKNSTEEIVFGNIIGKLVVDTREPSNMVLPLTSEREKKYLKLKSKFENLNFLRKRCGEILFKKLMDIEEFKQKKVFPLMFELRKDDENRLNIKIKISSENYDFLEKFTQELKCESLFNNFEILSVSNKSKIYNMEILIFVNLESVLND